MECFSDHSRAYVTQGRYVDLACVTKVCGDMFFWVVFYLAGCTNRTIQKFTSVNFTCQPPMNPTRAHCTFPLLPFHHCPLGKDIYFADALEANSVLSPASEGVCAIEGFS